MLKMKKERQQYHYQKTLKANDIAFSSFSDCVKVVSIAKRGFHCGSSSHWWRGRHQLVSSLGTQLSLSNLQTTSAITVRQCLGATSTQVGVLFLLLLQRFQRVLFLWDCDDVRSQNLLSPSPPLPQQLADHLHKRTNLLL